METDAAHTPTANIHVVATAVIERNVVLHAILDRRVFSQVHLFKQ
jgi:hypothetical protein